MTRPLPSLNALRAFEATVRLGSLARAAGELHVTHGAISRQLRLLENDLGVPLFRRSGRSLEPTAAAMQLAEATGQALEQMRNACARARQGVRQTPLALGCAASVLARWIIPRLPQLERDVPGLRLHLSPQESLPDATLSGLDAALLLIAPPWPATWRVRKLAPERIGPVLAASHPDADNLRNAPVTALQQQALLHTASRPQAWPDWAARHGLAAETLHYGTGFDHLYYLLEAASAGLGIAIAPEPLVRADLDAGRLIAPWGFVETDAVWALCSPDGPTDPRLPPLANWLQWQLGEPGGGSISPPTHHGTTPGP